MSEALQRAENIATVDAFFKKHEFQITRALPKHMNSERMARIALTELSRNPKLQKCSLKSLFGAVIQCSQLGLEPGPMGLAYLIPRWNSKAGCDEVNFQVGYKGLIELAKRSGEIEWVTMRTVREGDVFSHRLGMKEELTHERKAKPGAKATHFYCVVTLHSGRTYAESMSVEEVEDHRHRYVKKTKDGAWPDTWVNNFEEMAMKTVAIRILKTASKSPELLTAIAADEADQAGKIQHNEVFMGEVVKEDVVDVEFSEAPSATEAVAAELKARKGAAKPPEPAPEPVQPTLDEPAKPAAYPDYPKGENKAFSGGRK